MEESEQVSRRAFLRRSAALVAGASVIVACGAAPQAGQATAPQAAQTTAAQAAPAQAGVKTIRVVSGQDVTELQVRQQIGDMFNKAHSDIKAEIAIVKGDRYESQQLMIAGGNSPDVLYLNPGFLYALAARDALLPLDSYIATDNISFDGVLPTAVDIGKYKGKMVAMPFEVAPLTLVYNKKLFDAAGVPYPTTNWADPNWSWDAFVETAKKLTKLDQKQYGVHIDSWMFSTFVFQNGGHVLTNSRDITADTKCVLDSPQAVEALQWLVDLQTKHKVHAPASDTAQLSGFDRFMSGKVAMYVYGRWLNTFRTIKDFEWDVAALPHPTGKEPKTLLLDLHYGISSRSKTPDAAWQYLKFMTTKEPQTTNVSTGMAVSVVDSINQSGAFLLSKPPSNERVYIDALKYAVPEEVNAVTTSYSAALNTELESIFSGSHKVQDGLTAATKSINKALDDWRTQHPST